ncbi:MAG: lactate racemase domain-containing protein [Candidatus Heimdallarchaeota archaeon]
MRLKLPQLCWYEKTDLELTFPDSWNVVFRRMKGHDNPKIAQDEIRTALSNPIGTAPISELAKGKKKIVIIFDDMTRPTRVSEIVPFVLEELQVAGIQDSQIRFICALGAHGVLTLEAFQKKLGRDIPARFPVYNHNVYDNCVSVGTTSQGTPVAINKEVMACDLKIAIGSIVPHVFTGFGGGSKIILPGVASIDTIVANHRQAARGGQMLSIMGSEPKDNPMMADMEEAAKLAGLDIKIDALMNTWGECTHLFVGDPIAEYYAGVKVAKEVYATEMVKDADIVIANSYAKANEGSVAMSNGVRSLKEEGGDMVIIANAPDGQVTHYVYGSFGKESLGKLAVPRKSNPRRVNNMIIYTKNIDIASGSWYAPPENITWAKTWDDVLKKLDSQQKEPKVAVYPDLTIQYFTEN